MMRNNLTGMIAVTLLTVLAGGCAGTKARQLAAKIQPQVKAYDEQLEKVKQAELASYARMADDAQTARETLLLTDMVDFRLNESTRFADRLASDSDANATRTELVDFLVGVATRGSGLYKELFESEMQARTDFLSQLEALDKRSGEIDTVQQQLLHLSQKSKGLDSALSLAKFIQEVGKQVQANKNEAK